jgi:hypothetical protein
MFLFNTIPLQKVYDSFLILMIKVYHLSIKNEKGIYFCVSI